MKITIEKIRRDIKPLLKKHGVKKAALFGSVVRGTLKKGSDIDILVELPKDRSLLDLIALKLDLEKKIKREADVLTPGALHPLLKRIIEKEKVEI